MARSGLAGRMAPLAGGRRRPGVALFAARKLGQLSLPGTLARDIVGEVERLDRPLAEDEALTCLAELAAVSGELYRRISEFSTWARAVNQQSPGMTYSRALSLDRRVAMTGQISEAIKVLSRDGNKFRRLEARALYEEGLTMAQLAAVFGVSRQRVSILLREAGTETETELDG